MEKESRLAFVCQALKYFVVPECFDLTHFLQGGRVSGCFLSSAALKSVNATTIPPNEGEKYIHQPIRHPWQCIYRRWYTPRPPRSLQWQIKSCHLLMVINYWYLADCMQCLCQGVKCLQLLSPRLPSGCPPPPPLPFTFKSQLWGEVVSCWDLMRTWEK